MTLEDSLKVERKQWLKEGLAEGLAEGRAEAQLNAVDRLVASGLADEAKACEVLGVSPEDYSKYKRGIQKQLGQ